MPSIIYLVLVARTVMMRIISKDSKPFNVKEIGINYSSFNESEKSSSLKLHPTYLW